MRELLDQIETAASHAHLYYLALAGALVIPDICGALGSADGQADGKRYKSWFDAHMAPLYAREGKPPVLTGEDCWRFRCSWLHQGRSQHPKSAYTRIMFIEPGTSTNIFHMCIMGDALNIDVARFCIDLVQAARRWADEVENSEPYETNLKSFVRRYANGLAPYHHGVAVIS